MYRHLCILSKPKFFVVDVIKIIRAETFLTFFNEFSCFLLIYFSFLDLHLHIFESCPVYNARLTKSMNHTW